MAFVRVASTQSTVFQSISFADKLILRSKSRELEENNWYYITDTTFVSEGELASELANYSKKNSVVTTVTPTDNGDDTCTVDLSNLGAASEVRCKATVDCDCSFTLPTPQTDNVTHEYFEKEILLYAHFTDEVSVDWGNNILFYGNEVPDIEEGYYEIVFTFDVNAAKWCVGVLSKGDGE